MKEIKLSGQKRNDLGKKASRLMRKEGLVPCNLYGEKKENGISVALSLIHISELVTPKEVVVCSIKATRNSRTAAVAEAE